MIERTDNHDLSTADLVRRPQPATAEPVMEAGTTEPMDQVVDSQPPAEVTRSGDAEERPPLFSPADTEDFRTRWSRIQTGFVDEPRRAVEQADSLVAEVIQRLASVFADERSTLEGQWDRGDDISTEDLRVALQRYRSFFDRLLTV